MAESRIALGGLVKGRVQGVFFRAETQKQANRLQLTGWVRNTAEGAVEVLICGRETDVGDMVEWLHQGPALARVEEVQLQPVDWPELEGFQIRS